MHDIYTAAAVLSSIQVADEAGVFLDSSCPGTLVVMPCFRVPRAATTDRAIAATILVIEGPCAV